VVPYHPLDIKLGHWEATTTTYIPIGWADKVPKTKVFKRCLSNVDEPWTIVYDGGQGCFKTLLASTSNKQEIRIRCDRTGALDTTIRIKAKDSEDVKGSGYMGAGYMPALGDFSFSAKMDRG